MGKELTIFLLVRQDLKMGKGKIGAQCGHAVQHLIRGCPDEVYKRYTDNGLYPKIVLKVPDLKGMDLYRNMAVLKKVRHYQVVDLGRTQVEPNTPTVLGVGPIYKDEFSELGELKLL